MTEKRFELVLYDGTQRVKEVTDNGKVIYPNELVELLNALHKENNELKNILKDITLQLDANHTMQTYQMTIPLNKVIYNELNRRLKKSSFNEDLRSFLDD